MSALTDEKGVAVFPETEKNMSKHMNEWIIEQEKVSNPVCQRWVMALCFFFVKKNMDSEKAKNKRTSMSHTAIEHRIMDQSDYIFLAHKSPLRMEWSC